MQTHAVFHEMETVTHAQATQRHVELCEEIRRHDHSYYILAKPVVSDRQYDRLMEELSELEKQMYADSSRSELWWLLIYGFLAFTAFEVWMTRRMLHGATNEATA